MKTLTPKKILHSQSKDKKILQQIALTDQQFYSVPQSMKMLSISTGIDRSNICRYVAKFQKLNKIAVYKRAVCAITKRVVNFYTTNPELFPANPQQSLF